MKNFVYNLAVALYIIAVVVFVFGFMLNAWWFLFDGNMLAGVVAFFQFLFIVWFAGSSR